MKRRVFLFMLFVVSLSFGGSFAEPSQPVRVFHLNHHEGLLSLMGRAGCNPTQLAAVMSANKINTAQLAYLKRQRPIYVATECAAPASKEITRRSIEILASENARIANLRASISPNISPSAAVDTESQLPPPNIKSNVLPPDRRQTSSALLGGLSKKIFFLGLSIAFILGVSTALFARPRIPILSVKKTSEGWRINEDMSVEVPDEFGNLHTFTPTFACGDCPEKRISYHNISGHLDKPIHRYEASVPILEFTRQTA